MRPAEVASPRPIMMAMAIWTFLSGDVWCRKYPFHPGATFAKRPWKIQRRDGFGWRRLVSPTLSSALWTDFDRDNDPDLILVENGC